MKIKLNNLRLAFPSLWEAKTVNGEGKPAFSGTFLLDPADPQVKTVEAAIALVAKDKWGAKADTMLKQIKAGDKTCLHNGDLKATYEGFPGNLFIAARNPVRPTVLDKDKTPLVEADGKPYAGCYVHAVLELWAQDNAYGKRINATIMGVQFFADGDSFTGGGKAASDDDFDDVSAGATADDLA
jgi:Protein of unknown function (DUF2815)